MLDIRLLALLATVVAADEDYRVVNAKIELPDSAKTKGPPSGLKLEVFAPDSTLSFPVIWFSTGFGADVPLSIYSKLINRIVARGYIVAGLYHELPHFPNYINDGHSFHNIMEWGRTGLAQYMVQKNLTAVPDVIGRSAVMAQSAGNHVVGQALSDGCSVAKAFVMIDAVDGVDPYGFIKQFLIKPGSGDKVNFTIPALLLDNGLDPKSVNSFSPPCAPPKTSNDHFYNAWRGPIWNINATAYGHIDCTDTQKIADLICPTNPHTDKDLYIAMLADAATSFLGALFDGKPEQLSVFDNSTHWKVDVVLKHDLKGKKAQRCCPRMCK